jgi:hypothetical protein
VYQNFIITYLYEAQYVSGDTPTHLQEPKTALAASGFSYVEGCWMCSWWTLSGTLCLTILYELKIFFFNLIFMREERRLSSHYCQLVRWDFRTTRILDNEL